ncbi:hypothetical protein [Streptomyces cellulosae]|uniref:hypothetical protein n=1 Tax=Streptomyces cellulosae TaxID=1968 RepID=UPI0004C88CD2|nr:hypothetical protein [Streptomyces cellulosae]
MVTSATFNALLKVIEKPTEHLKFVAEHLKGLFATTEPSQENNKFSVDEPLFEDDAEPAIVVIGSPPTGR